jgi:hypothetical protein
MDAPHDGGGRAVAGELDGRADVVRGGSALRVEVVPVPGERSLGVLRRRDPARDQRRQNRARVGERGEMQLEPDALGVVLADDEPFELTLYEDTSGAVAAGLVALALSSPGELDTPGPPLPAATAEARYRCSSIEDYAAGFGLSRARGLG